LDGGEGEVVLGWGRGVSLFYDSKQKLTLMMSTKDDPAGYKPVYSYKIIVFTKRSGFT